MMYMQLPDKWTWEDLCRAKSELYVGSYILHVSDFEKVGPAHYFFLSRFNNWDTFVVDYYFWFEFAGQKTFSMFNILYSAYGPGNVPKNVPMLQMEKMFPQCFTPNFNLNPGNPDHTWRQFYQPPKGVLLTLWKEMPEKQVVFDDSKQIRLEL